MKEYSIGDSEFKVMEVIWANAPVASGTLSAICEEKYGWKKTTIYTMLKRLEDKGFIKNEKTIVSYVVDREEVERQQSEELVKKTFRGSLPMFVNAFLGERSLSKEDAAELIDMIEKHTDK